ncbi:DUF1217 domain-containing protein [Sedimentitalea todarodis]|uniref:DUF1217 domain-containing protein n=1 Tax=Sedimentitalea todarodis TaxID=1631240 RepID=A0ABU3VBF1_9RHOB|nr:DUF1217 domain-containing protein [Sedimentitalea todarodis]MDU9003089.1 DUF1217 domain-containing protein [Sedimentitalea todarodis]
MTFQPVVVGSGIAGWKFLQRTYEPQFDAFEKSSQLSRNIEYFTDTIGTIETAEDLVKNRRVLSVALGAFGLQDDLDNRYFIQKILEDGTASDDALANKLADDRYKRLSAAFGFGPGEAKTTANPQKMAKIVENFKVQSFEISVGEQNDTMRVALYAQRELASLANEEMSEEAKWYTLMGLPPLRSLFETSLGLPASFGQIDIDQQYEVFRERTRSVTGDDTVAQFANTENIERLTQLFLARSQIAEIGTGATANANALTLLEGLASQIR